MAGEFTRHGYQTQAVGKMHVYPERSQVGFQNVMLHDGYLHFARNTQPNLERVDDYLPWLRQRLGYAADYADHGIDCNSYVARPWDKDESLHPTTWVVTQALDFLRRRDLRMPFFLFMSFHRPHPPYDPPTWAFEQYLDQPMPEPPVGSWHQRFASAATPGPSTNYGRLDPRWLQRTRAGYYGHMTHIDHQINRFLEGLNAFNPGPTYICFTSDHGELLGDHHLWRKSLPYEGSARVPLILKGPVGSGIRSGGQCAQPVELRDILPTLLDCAGLPIPQGLDGRSLLPLARGQQTAWRPCVHGEHLYGDQSVHYVTDGKAKFIWFSSDGAEQCFDLERDPTELHDLSADAGPTQRMAQFRSWMVEALQGREEGFTDGRVLIPGRPVQPVLSFLRPPTA